MTKSDAATFFLGVLSLIAVLTVLWSAKGLFAPVFAALVVGVVCAPVTDKVERAGLPRVFAALMVLAGLLLSLLALFFVLEPAVSEAIRNAPTIWRELTEFLSMARATLSGVEELQETVSEALTEGGAESAGDDTASVTVPGVLDALALAPSFAAAMMIFIGTLYFFLIARHDIYAKADGVRIRLSESLLFDAERRVSRYFLTITMINAGFGTLVGMVMAALGMPSPMVWGLCAFLVNFVLYLGPAMFAVALTIVGIIQFDGAMSFVPPLVYLAMNATEGQFVTPSLVGRHMRINPLLIFLSLVFWLWLWGPVGGVVAIPILVWSLFVLGKLTAEPVESDGSLQRKT